LNFINIYGPYSNQNPFWEDLLIAGVLSKPLTIIGGDLNFTISLREVWGSNPRIDGLRDYFVSLLENQKLLTLNLSK
jgi:hypothetical protein